MSVFDRLAADVGAGYMQRPGALRENFVMLLKGSLLPMLCAAKCVPFQRTRGLEPHEMSPCGHLVSKRALDEAAAHKCPACSMPIDHAHLPVSERALLRASALTKLREHYSPLPPHIEQTSVSVGAQGYDYIGYGNIGAVYTAMWKPYPDAQSCVDVAVKQVTLQTQAQRRLALQAIATAFAASRGMGARSVCKVHGYWEEPFAIHMIMERCSSSLVEKVATGNGGKLSALEATSIGAELAGHLVRLHDELHIWHLALKPSNILVRSDGSAVLSDFRSAVNAVTRQIQTMLGAVTTDYFAAPEQQQGFVRSSTDTYSLGCVIVYMLTGAAPRGAQDIPQPLPMKLTQLLESMLHMSSYARPAMRDVHEDLAAIAEELKPAPEHVVRRFDWVCQATVYNEHRL